MVALFADHRRSVSAGGSRSPLLPVSGGLPLGQGGEGARAAPPRLVPLRLRRLRTQLQPLVPAEGPRQVPHRRAAVPVRRLQDALHRAAGAEEAPGDPQPAGRASRRRVGTPGTGEARSPTGPL